MCQAAITQKDQILLVKLTGDLILSCTNELKDKVKAAIEAHQNFNVVVDLNEVEFIDSSGLGVLIAWFKHTNQGQGNIIFSNMSEYVKKIVHLSKLDKIFTLTDSMDEAFACFKQT